MQSNQPDMRADDKNKRPVSDKSPALMLMRVLQGALIGGGAILPGVSGGVLAVVFGIYRPMMELLSHPFRALKKNLWLFIPIVIGVGIGFVGFAKLMALLFAEDSPYPISLFVGLILGTVPSLLKTARSQGRKPAADMTALILTFAGLLAFLIILEGTGSMNLTLTPVWALISGLIWGFSLIVPGLSSSSILIFMGLYKSIMDDVGRLQLGTVIPLLLGIALVAFLFARVIDSLFNKRFSVASHAIVGLVLASTIMIIPRVYAGLGQILLCLGLAVIGFAGAWYLGVWGEKYEAHK
ncbi:MAG: DUF368 domain-containing protein [Clostridia bacterium]|nr:DUF368 domain-containing protein [Clostridia bacterium]